MRPDASTLCATEMSDQLKIVQGFQGHRREVTNATVAGAWFVPVPVADR